MLRPRVSEQSKKVQISSNFHIETLCDALFQDVELATSNIVFVLKNSPGGALK